MPDKINRRDLIVQTASDLFMSQGYENTSVRQIAEATSMTESALYYHFKDGKRGLLQAVIECQMPDLVGIVELCSHASSLREMLRTFGEIMGKLGPAKVHKLRWLMREFQHLSQEERAHLHSKYIRLQQGIAAQMDTFLHDPEKSRCLAWMLICATFGYGQLFWSLELKESVDFPFLELIETLAETMGSAE
jgi:AcrR family transcriptional regulator